MSTATDATLMAIGERFEKLLREHMDAWLTWAPRIRAARAEVVDNTASLAVAIQRTGCDTASMAERRRSSRLMTPKTPRFWPEMKTRRGLAVSWPRYPLST